MEKKRANDEEIPLLWREAVKSLAGSPETCDCPLITIPIRVALDGERQSRRTIYLATKKPHSLKDTPIANMRLAIYFKQHLLILLRTSDEDSSRDTDLSPPELLSLGEILITPNELHDLWLNKEIAIHLPVPVHSGIMFSRGKQLSVRVDVI